MTILIKGCEMECQSTKPSLSFGCCWVSSPFCETGSVEIFGVISDIQNLDLKSLDIEE